METINKIKAFDKFLNEEDEKTQPKKQNTKKKLLDRRDGIVERVDKILVTKDGKQLLREVY